MLIGDALLKIGVDTKGLETGLKEIEKATEKAASSMSKQFQDIGKVATVMGAAITASMTGMIMSFANTGSELYNLSLKTGVSAKALAGLKYAAEQSGGSLGTVEIAIRAMANTMADAEKDTSEMNRKLAEASATGKLTAEAMLEIQNSGGQATKAFKALGISIADLQGLSPEEQFIKIAAAVAEVPDPMKRSALASDIFGTRLGTQLLPMLAGGADGLKKMTEEGIRLSGWTDEGARSADELGDAFGSLKIATGGLFSSIAEQLAPALTSILETITSVIATIKDWASAHPELTRLIGLAAGALGLFLLHTGGLILILPKIIGFITTIGAVMGGMGATTTVAGTAAAGLGASFTALLIPIGLLIAAFAVLGTGLVLLASHKLKVAELTRLNAQATEEYTKMLAGEANGYSAVLEKQIKLYESFGNLTKAQRESLAVLKERLITIKAEEEALKAEEATQARVAANMAVSQQQVAIINAQNIASYQLLADEARKARQELDAAMNVKFGMPADIANMLEHAKSVGATEAMLAQFQGPETAQGWANIRVMLASLIQGLAGQAGTNRERQLALDMAAAGNTLQEILDALGYSNVGELSEAIGLGTLGIPGFARGGLIPEPTLLTSLRTMRPYAIAGEAGPERVVPGSGSGNGKVNITVLLDSRILAEALNQPMVDNILVRTGIRF